MFNFKNGGGNGSLSGYSTRVIQYKLATELRSFHFILYNYLLQAAKFSSVTLCVGMAWVHGLKATGGQEN